MQILTLDHLQETTPDAEFGPSRVTGPAVFMVSFSVVLGATAAAIGIIPRGPIPAVVLWVIAIFSSCVGALAYTSIRSMAATKPWICRACGNTLLIRCSYREQALVLQLDRAELAWAQALKLTYLWKSPRGGRQFEYYRYFELGLSDSATTALETFTQDDSIAKKVREQIAPAGIVFNCPARLIRTGVIRLCWMGISPGLAETEKFFSKWTQVRPRRREKMGNE